ncbi:MAG: SMC family ATPase [Acidimicrobiia bacterium]|nr:SMC family ATPase [Acidimicrobiia bacterium]MDX2468461.1 SMC family ATPase [Acidimicrobiia bacterium]
MRPLELKMRNFRSYAGEHSFDFRERTLVGVVGPIGSGKSSLLDGIAFALYGRTPRIGSATKTLINQRAADMSVVLRFVVEGEVWEAARSIRIKGQSKHALYRYEDDSAEAEPVEKLTMEGEVNDRIVELLGLEFSAFERSVLLAQGRFAEFLQARPVERDKVLKGVFGHDRVDRMKSLAKERKDHAGHALEKLAIRLEKVDEIKQRVAKNQDLLATVRKRTKKLDNAAKRIAALEQTQKVAAETVRRTEERLAGLEGHAGRLPDQATTRQSLTEAGAAEKRRVDLGSALDKAQQRLQTVEKKLAAAIDAGEPDLIARSAQLLAAATPQLKAVVDADRRIAAAAERHATAQGEISTVLKTMGEAEQVKDHSLGRAVEAVKILEDAERALQHARHADMAATLRVGLALDTECPVCEQLILEIPDSHGDTHLVELEQVVDSARLTKQDVDETRTIALTTLERTKEQQEAAKEKVSATESQLAAAREDAMRARGDFEETTLQLEKILGPGDPGDHLDQRRGTFEGLANDRDEVQRNVDQTRGQHDQAIRDEQEAGKLIQDLGMRVAELATRLEFPVEIGEDTAALGDALEKLRTHWGKKTKELGAEHKSAHEAATEAEEEHRQLISNLEIEGDFAATQAVLADRTERLEHDIAADNDSLQEAKDLFAERARLEDQIELFGRINSDLTDSRFVRFLLDEERSRLAELGSEHFQQLSGGRYRFADDQFAIVDLTAADSVRRADSLSGGETFLASLGLALALAEMVAGTGGRLDAFFLDEGFGTLDPEHLDLAMEGIEQLVADQSDRLVVVVSHVPEMRMRLEDLIELERNPVTGDTKVVSK